MIDKTTVQRIVNRLNNAYGYSPTINSAAARALAELWAELERVKRERDAAIADMEEMQGNMCRACKHYYQPDPNVRKWSCRVLGEYWTDICDHEGGLLECSNFEWRGVQEDERVD